MAVIYLRKLVASQTKEVCQLSGLIVFELVNLCVRIVGSSLHQDQIPLSEKLCPHPLPFRTVRLRTYLGFQFPAAIWHKTSVQYPLPNNRHTAACRGMAQSAVWNQMRWIAARRMHFQIGSRRPGMETTRRKHNRKDILHLST